MRLSLSDGKIPPGHTRSWRRLGAWNKTSDRMDQIANQSGRHRKFRPLEMRLASPAPGLFLPERLQFPRRPALLVHMYPPLSRSLPLGRKPGRKLTSEYECPG